MSHPENEWAEFLEVKWMCLSISTEWKHLFICRIQRENAKKAKTEDNSKNREEPAVSTDVEHGSPSHKFQENDSEKSAKINEVYEEDLSSDVKF